MGRQADGQAILLILHCFFFRKPYNSKKTKVYIKTIAIFFNYRVSFTNRVGLSDKYFRSDEFISRDRFMRPYIPWTTRLDHGPCAQLERKKKLGLGIGAVVVLL